MPPGPPKDLQQLLDREAIREVMLRYAAGLDRRDFAMVGACFTADAHAIYGGVDHIHGVDRIIAHIQGLLNLKASSHFVGNQLIALHGDTADMESYAVAHLIQTRGGQDIMRIRGLRYIDKMVRQDGLWLIADRIHTCDWMYEVPVTCPGNPPPPPRALP